MRPELPAILRAQAVRSVLAYCIVAGGLFLLGFAWLTGAPEVERVAAAVAGPQRTAARRAPRAARCGLIGLVLGSCFGSRSSASPASPPKAP